MKVVLILTGLAMLTAGCETLHTDDRSGEIDQTAFAKFWDLYERCRTGSDLESVLVSAARLSRALPPRPHRSSGVPSPFARFVARQPLRLAADPSAMAADCTLRAVRAALKAGLTPLAQESFESVLQRFHDSDYAYYRDEARRGLAEIGRAAERKPVEVFVRRATPPRHIGRAVEPISGTEAYR
ncbi:MAG: hypothetical protein KatS3mg082_1088 [Nitrospiraceae bacterium]|nr:MAG: hypothetical protein KatS3mg082_1088 [Nitrospiraceae bacterium]